MRVSDEAVKQPLKLDGRKVIVQEISCYEYVKTDKAFIYRKEVIYHFKNEEEATEYYYKNK